MKRILSAFIAFITLFTTLALTSCGKKDDTPDGMQLVMGGESLGYYFYGPEEWIVANFGDIACTYVSKIDLSSMTFVEAEKPEGTIAEYFESEKSKFPYTIEVSVDGDECLFGNASKANKYVYTYTYKNYDYTCMQIFVSHADRFFIFTYTANNAQRNGDQTYYQYYLEKVSASIDAFKFTDKSAANTEKEYERDSDGYKLVSDKTLAGFDMYVPDEYKVDYSSAMVSVSHSDNTNITMAQATYTSVSSKDYWGARKENINAFANGSVEEIAVANQIKLDGTKWALAYEYTYVYEGVKYHVYQVQIVTRWAKGYVFTYTATEENYEKHFTEMESVLRKIEY